MALTQILYKIFVKGFYKVHSGQLLFLFGTILTYLFYIQVLSDDHITTQETIFYNLSFILTIISSPILAVLMMFVFLIFTLKSHNYISAQIYLPNNFFLFYSANSLSKSKQLISWFISQLLISFPIILYIVFALIVGFVYGYYFIPILFLCFVLGVSLLCAFSYIYLTNKPIKAYNGGLLLKFVKQWKKSLLTIKFVQIFDKHLITFLISKFLAVLLAFGLTEILSDFNQLALGALIASIMALSNVVLIFEIYRFEHQYLSFILNFPTKLSTTFLQWVLTIIILVLSEIIALKFLFDWKVFLNSFFILVATCLFLKSLLLMISLNMKSFLYKIFILLFVGVILIQFGLSPFVGFAYFALSGVIFSKKYYHQA